VEKKTEEFRNRERTPAVEPGPGLPQQRGQKKRSPKKIVLHLWYQSEVRRDKKKQSRTSLHGRPKNGGKRRANERTSYLGTGGGKEQMQQMTSPDGKGISTN